METTQTNSDPAAIVEQLKTLTDIEGDLAETAIVVQATDPAATSNDNPVSVQLNGSEAEPAADASNAAVESTLQTAEVLETVLESAIPPGPEDVLATTGAEPPLAEPSGAPIAPSEQPQISVPPIDVSQDDNQLNSSLPITQSEDAASQAQDAVQIVAADVNNPILPSTEAIDASNGEVEGGASISMDVQGSDAPADADPHASTVDAASIQTVGPSSGPSVPMPNPATTSASQFRSDPQFLEDAKELPSQTPYQSLEAPKIDVDLPAGLTSASPSVIENAHLMNLWRREPNDPRNILDLFEFSVQRSEAPDARAWYHTLSEIEPAAVKPLLALINLELSLSNFSEVESLFARALKGTGGDITAAADVSIWKAYLHYIRRQNPIPDGATNVEHVRSTITKAYEFALQQCGTDRESGDVWQEYISFLTEANPKNTWETQQQMDSLRKVYQRAICVPLNNVEALWKAYDAFESGLNKLTAKKFLAERSPAYMTARTALRELRALTEGIPHPSLPPQPDFSDHDRTIVNLWKAYLRWEESNPLVIEDQSVLTTRVKYALRQCLGDMRHFPELWHYAANWHLQAGRKDEAVEVLQAGVQACPQSFILTFALADLEEDRGKFTNCHEIYEALLNRLNPEIDELKIAVAAEVDRARGPEITRPTGDDAMNGDDGLAEVTRMIDEREARGRHVAESRGKDVDELSVAASVVWIMYMRFARRAEGIKAARGVFGKARKSTHITWHTFEASAMMEYHSNKDSAVAIRIFELGFKLFSENVDYVVRYLQFLLSVNDDSNARALFERSAPKIPAEKARPLWDAWARYEYMYGDLSGVHKLEARFVEVFPHDSPLKRFAQRFIYNGIDQVALRDLGFGRRQAAPAPTPVPTESRLPPPPPSLPPIPTMPAQSPPQKRPFPDRSPQLHGRARGSVDRSQSPSAKRYRPASPPPRRYPLPERERVPSAGRYDDRSSLPPPPGGRGSIPPHAPPMNMGPGRGSVPPSGDFDRSGLSRPLSWFIDSLPSARSFNGPVFRADDIMHLFNSIGRDGRGIPGPPPPARAPYAPPDARYGAPPPRGRY